MDSLSLRRVLIVEEGEKGERCEALREWTRGVRCVGGIFSGWGKVGSIVVSSDSLARRRFMMEFVTALFVTWTCR